MALTILPQQQSFGSSFGSGLGAGLAQGTQGILEGLQKKQDHATSVRRLIEAGVPEYEANIIAQFRPQEQAALYSKFLESGGGPLANLVPTPQVGAEGLVDKLGASRAPEGPNPEERAPEAIGSMRTGERPRSVGEALQAQKSEAQRQQAEKESKKEQLAIRKETQPYVDKITAAFKDAKETEKDIKRLEKIVDQGYLGVPLANTTIKALKNGIPFLGIGLDLSFLMTADAQELDKLSTSFARHAKSWFPGRVTDADLRTYLSTIPNLAQTKDGMKRVIKSIKSANEAAKITHDAMRDIIKENNGRRPIDLQMKVDERIGDKLDRLYDDFINIPVGTEDKGLKQIGKGLLYY